MASKPTSLCLQGRFPPGEPAPGWAHDCVVISGGHLAWGKQPALSILEATREEVLRVMNGHLKPIRAEILKRPGCRVVLDFEGGLRLNTLAILPRGYLPLVRRAVALRLSCAREFFGHSPLLGAYIGGWGLNGLAFGGDIERESIKCLLAIARPPRRNIGNLWRSEPGAFDEADFLWQRAYAMLQPYDNGWWKQRHMTSTGLSVCRLMGKPVYCGLSIEVFGGSEGHISAEGLREQMEWAKPFDGVDVYAGDKVGDEQAVEFTRGVALGGAA